MDKKVAAFLESTKVRSKILDERIRQRTDIELRKLVNSSIQLSFDPIKDFLVSPAAWKHIVNCEIKPHQVFAHPKVLQKHPKTALYYRGLCLLPRKRILQCGGPNVARWEDEDDSITVSQEAALRFCQVCNLVMSAVIEGAIEWTLEDGYRNIMHNIGITLDGSFRNIIGHDAEDLIKTKVSGWLNKRKLVLSCKQQTFELLHGIKMLYSSEPDIQFLKDGQQIATIEIKGGKDPAGALERLGAVQKSFGRTPARCQNILVSGIVTEEMQRTRLGTSKCSFLKTY